MDTDHVLQDLKKAEADKHSMIAMHTMITLMRQKNIKTEEGARTMLKGLHADAVANTFSCFSYLIEEAATILGVEAAEAAAASAPSAPSAASANLPASADEPDGSRKRGRPKGASQRPPSASQRRKKLKAEAAPTTG
jgi:hypothetical protein